MDAWEPFAIYVGEPISASANSFLRVHRSPHNVFVSFCRSTHASPMRPPHNALLLYPAARLPLYPALSMFISRIVSTQHPRNLYRSSEATAMPNVTYRSSISVIVVSPLRHAARTLLFNSSRALSLLKPLVFDVSFNLLAIHTSSFLSNVSPAALRSSNSR